MRPNPSRRIGGTAVAALTSLGLVLSGCASQPAPGLGVNGTLKPYQVRGVWYRPHAQPHYDAVGVATWYGEAYAGRRTATGETYDPAGVSGAHTTLPLPGWVLVTNLSNGRSLKVRLNDRGPFEPGRILDLSREAARRLGISASARVRVQWLGPAGRPGEPPP